MPTLRDEAVVLSRFDYSETSQVVVLFTREHGKVRALAKGIKRSTKTRFAAGVDLLDVGHVTISQRRERSGGLAPLTEWKQTRSLAGLRDRLFRIHGAQYVAEVTVPLTEEHDPHGALFSALVSTLADLSASPEPLGPVVPYQLGLLQEIGLLPRFDVCLLCGRHDDLTHLSSFEGGMICRHCEPGQIEKWAVSPAALEVVRASDKTAGRRRVALAEAFRLLNYHIAHLMGRQPRLASKLAPVLRRGNA